MATVNTKMNYDLEEDILVLSKGNTIKASIDYGDFVVDVDHNGFVTGIEILNASQNFGLKEEQLKSLKQVIMNVTYRPNYVRITLIIKLENQEKDVIIPLNVDLGHGSITTEKTNFAVA